MKVYNTLSRKIEEFVPHQEGHVLMYTCGPTVYYFAHIGNLRTYIFEDILEKGLTYLGYEVTRVMNITDVGHMTSDSDTGEDKMIKGALREGKTVYELAEFYTKAFFLDLKKLNIKKPSIVEKASDHIDMYIKMIQRLLDKGYAYSSNGNIYFDISKANDYYKLSSKNPCELMVGVRDTVEEDSFKKNPYDFGLWFTVSKFSNQVMKWDSPWGVGYPGWHIECSGISIEHLGEYLDIHCGGVDNIFPHHTNEIAQSEAYLGHPWCRYWMHGEHLNDASGKMSKSKGDVLTVSYLEQLGYDPLSYRYFCLGSHYRKPLVFSFESLDGAEKAYKKLKAKVQMLSREGEIDSSKISFYQKQFKEALENDLNTSMMLTVLYDVLKDESLTDASKYRLVEEMDAVLGLRLLEKEENSQVDEDILIKIEERNQAKKEKNFSLADQIRDELLEQGIKIIDTREGTIFKRI